MGSKPIGLGGLDQGVVESTGLGPLGTASKQGATQHPDPDRAQPPIYGRLGGSAYADIDKGDFRVLGYRLSFVTGGSVDYMRSNE